MVIVLNSRFPLGSLVATPNALAALTDWDLQVALQRHAAGDWGDLCNQDKEANSTALLRGGRLLSAFHGQNGTKFWIITEADRSATTILLPEDY